MMKLVFACAISVIATLVVIALFAGRISKGWSWLRRKIEGVLLGLRSPKDTISDDSTVKEMAAFLRGRGWMWYWFSLATGVAIVLLVAGGVVVFLFSDNFIQPVGVFEEAELLRDRNELQERQEELRSSTDVAEYDAARLVKQARLWEPVAELRILLENVIGDVNEGVEPVKLAFFLSAVQTCRACFVNLNDRDTFQYPDNDLTFSDPDIDFAIELADVNLLDIGRLSDWANSIFELGDQPYDDWANPMFRAQLSEGRGLLQPIAELYRSLNERVVAATSNELDVKARGDQVELKEIEAELEAISLSLEEARKAREYFAQMQWIPMISVRIGVVVLLLFLTQIFASLLRYGVSLSGFYQSRADALQLVPPGSDDDAIDSEELSRLVETLSTERLGIEKTQSPTDGFVEVVKTLAGRKQ